MRPSSSCWPCALCLLAALAPACDKKAETEPVAAEIIPAGGSARVTVGEHGFAPSALSIARGPAGSTAAVTFLRTTDGTCAKEVVFPALGIKKDLPLNAPIVVDVPTEDARTLTFQCGMAMYKGALVVR